MYNLDAKDWAKSDDWRRMQGEALERLGHGPLRTPSRRMLEGPGFRLLDHGGEGPPVLLLPAPIKRAYIWDLNERASVVRRCLENGCRVLLLEWIEDERINQAGLAWHACDVPLACAEAIRAETGDWPAIVGHSLGGTFAAIFAALYPQCLRGVVLVAGPVRFGPAAGPLGTLVASSPPAGIVTAGLERVPGRMLNMAAATASPEEFIWWRMADWAASLADPPAMRLHMQVMRWSMDEFAMPVRLFREVMELLYRRDLFHRGRLVLGGRLARPRLSVPLFSVVDPVGTIVPPSSILGLSPDRCEEYEGDHGVGLRHVGMLVGASAQRRLWPRIIRWMHDL
ncbi:alpha/beta fold hydrolase [Telmatospirillum sp. J64-1]|uniref:alpha/beta fold hydrolase n=1 Tax=Telmatospirillum sp. J64-1 TaxID=2502183 RepID=UPI00163DE590|nr:alpha/beta fold hydrolase [Telmatospirillum sp. J64-1]